MARRLYCKATNPRIPVQCINLSVTTDTKVGVTRTIYNRRMPQTQADTNWIIEEVRKMLEEFVEECDIPEDK